MTPEEIEYMREWAASGNENRLSGHIPSVVLYRCCRLVGHGWWKLSESGLTIASQAEHIQEADTRRERNVRERAEERGNQMTEYCQKCGIRTTPEEPICQCVDVLREEIDRLRLELAFSRAAVAQAERIRELEAEVQAAKAQHEIGKLPEISVGSVAPSIWLGPNLVIDNSRTWTRTSPSSSSLSTRSLKDRDVQYLRHTEEALLLRTKIEQLEAEVQAAKALTRIEALEGELREWRCNTVPGRLAVWAACQPIGGKKGIES